MKELRFNNTRKSSRVTFLVIPQKDKFIGICLEFDLAIKADSMKEAQEQIQDYADLWFKNAVKNRLPEEALNRPADIKYWNIFKELAKRDQESLQQKKLLQKSFYTKNIRASYQYPSFNFA
jgi:hypothetical protein